MKRFILTAIVYFVFSIVTTPCLLQARVLECVSPFCLVGDTIPEPWRDIVLTGPKSKLLAQAPLHMHKRKRWMVPMVAAVGGGVAWRLLSKRKAQPPPLIVRDDVVSVPCGETMTQVEVLQNDEGGQLQVVDVIAPPDLQVTFTPDGLVLVSGLGSDSISFSYVVSDGSGVLQSATVWIHVVDQLPPQIFCPVDVSVDCSSELSVDETGIATAKDACTGDFLPVSWRDSVLTTVACGQMGYVARTFSAADFAGNRAQCTQLIHIQPDATPPELECPLPTSVNCMGDSIPGPEITGFPQVFDACSVDLSIQFSDDLSGVSNCMGDVIRTWLVRDSCGNEATCVQSISLMPLPCDLNVSFEIANADCGMNNGMVTTMVDPPGNYIYQWSNGMSGSALDGVSAGMYEVTITEVDLGCQLIAEVLVEEHAPQYIEILTSNPADCPNQGDISLLLQVSEIPYQVKVSGPLGNYTFEIAGGSIVELSFFMDIPPGDYVLEVVNPLAPQCSEVKNVSVSQLPPYDLKVLQIVHPTSPTSNDGSVQLAITDVEHHPPPYQIALNGTVITVVNSPTFVIDGLASGTYEIMAFDAFECPSEQILVDLESPFHVQLPTWRSAILGSVGHSWVLVGGLPSRVNLRVGKSKISSRRSAYRSQYFYLGLSYFYPKVLRVDLSAQLPMVRVSMLSRVEWKLGYELNRSKWKISMAGGIFRQMAQQKASKVSMIENLVSVGRKGLVVEAAVGYCLSNRISVELPISAFFLRKRYVDSAVIPSLTMHVKW